MVHKALHPKKGYDSFCSNWRVGGLNGEGGIKVAIGNIASVNVSERLSFFC